MKKVIYGWMGNDSKFEWYIDPSDNLIDFGTMIFSIKGKREDWARCHWPPKKVKITAEIED